MKSRTDVKKISSTDPPDDQLWLKSCLKGVNEKSRFSNIERTEVKLNYKFN